MFMRKTKRNKNVASKIRIYWLTYYYIHTYIIIGSKINVFRIFNLFIESTQHNFIIMVKNYSYSMYVFIIF